MCDSFLYGNALSPFFSLLISSFPRNSVSIFWGEITLAAFSYIKKKFQHDFIHYLDCTEFIKSFANAKDHSRIMIKFLKYFQTINSNFDLREMLKQYLNEINTLGFERWAGRNLFGSIDKFDTFKIYLYFIYNYWYHYINEIILSDVKIKEMVKDLSNIIIKEIGNNAAIYTTNFDNLFDTVLNPQHLHGKFKVPLNNFADIQDFYYDDKKRFEYTYLFGSNGFEKLSRLEKIKNNMGYNYNTAFFFDKKVNLGSLLIYGLAFGKSDVIPQEAEDKYRNTENLEILKSVDGHIIIKLIERKEKNKIKKITLSYYNQDDIDNYKKIFTNTSLKDIIEYKHCEEIFRF